MRVIKKSVMEYPDVSGLKKTNGVFVKPFYGLLSSRNPALAGKGGKDEKD